MSRCVQCHVATRFGYATDTYTRAGTDVAVTVTGIPADICPTCHESYLDMDAAREIEDLLAPFFDAAAVRNRLPLPTVRVDFPVPTPAKAA